MVNVYRQGDIIFKEATDNDGVKGLEFVHRMGGRSVMAHKLEMASETGNPHVAHAEVVEMPTRFSEGLIYAEEEIKVEHPQHTTLVLPTGVYHVQTVRDARTGRSMD